MQSIYIIIPTLFQKCLMPQIIISQQFSTEMILGLRRSLAISEDICNCYKLEVVEKDRYQQLLVANHFTNNMITLTTKQFLDTHVNSPKTEIL